MSRARDLAGIFNLNPLSGTTAQRPATAEVGDIYYNGTIGKTQIYTPTGWQDMASGIPFGNTANRPAGTIGQPYFNGETQRLELYTGSTYGWQNIIAETPGVTGYTGNVNESNSTNTITVTGTNFAGGAVVTLVGTDGTEYQSTTTTVSNLTTLSATFGVIPANKEPYDIRVTNPSNLYGVYYDILTVNDSPVWQTSAGSLGTFSEQTSISLTVSATDEENSTITYSLASGSSLPTGITLNSSTGIISGTLPDILADTTYTFTIQASDGVNISNRTFSITSKYTVPIEYLVVAGGGGGAWGNVNNDGNGGGGAGGLLSGTTGYLIGSTFSISVGTGGAAGPSGGGFASQGGNGGNSIFGSITATGGGGGGSDLTNTTDTSVRNGRNGGSGGGASTSGDGGIGGIGISGQGNNGGYANQPGGGGPGGGGGGGGGAGAIGGNGGQSSNGGAGGAGVSSSITGSALFYAAGGGGSSWTNSGGAGGSSIGGSGAARVSSTSATSPSQNTGSGGGAGVSTFSSSAGANGVVILAYPDIYPALTTIPGGLTYSQPTRSGYRVYRFTAGSGTVTL